MANDSNFSRRKIKRRSKQKDSQENFSIEIVTDLDTNLTNLKNMLEDPLDLVIREFTVRSTEHRCAMVYIDGLVDTLLLQTNIMKNVQLVSERKQLANKKELLFEEICQEIISIAGVQKVATLDEVTNSLLYGDTAFYLDGVDQVLMLDVKKWDGRQIEEPVSEGLIRGPREGFIENLQTNLMLIRRQIRDPNLRFKNHKIGRRSKKI